MKLNFVSCFRPTEALPHDTHSNPGLPLKLVSRRTPLAPGWVDCTASLIQADLHPGDNRSLWVRENSDEACQINAFGRYPNGLQQLLILGEDEQAFRGALNLLELGLIPRELPLPGGKADLATFLALHASEPPHPEGSISLEDRFKLLSARQFSLNAALECAIEHDNGATFAALLKALDVPITGETAVRWLQHERKKGFSNALCEFGVLLTHFVDKIALATHFLKRSAQHQNPNADYHLARLYLKDKGTRGEALRLLQKAHDNDHPLAAHALGQVFSKRQKLGDSAKWFRIAAESAITDPSIRPDAQFQYGFLMEHHQGVPPAWSENQIHPKIFSLYKEASQEGHLRARFRLGWLHYIGKGCPRNMDEAFKLWRKVIKNDPGNRVPDARLALFEFNPPSNPEARKLLLEKAAEGGIRLACYRMAEAHNNGEFGYKRDSQKAREWLAKYQSIPVSYIRPF